MSDYTPTTKGVTAYYCHARQEDTGVTVGEGAHEKFHAEFNHWLAEVKAETLREAADDFKAELGANAANPAPKYIVGWLHNRAAKLEATGDA